MTKTQQAQAEKMMTRRQAAETARRIALAAHNAEYRAIADSSDQRRADAAHAAKWDGVGTN